MAKIDVDTERILQSSKDIVNVGVHLREIKESLDCIRFAGTLGGIYGLLMNQRLKKIVEQISTEAANAASMADALQLIADRYKQTEKALLNEQISNAVRAHADADTSEAGEDKRNMFQKFWDWLTRKEPDKYDTTTAEQEKAADRAMRNKLWRILQDEKYSPENWDRSSVDERKKILQDYMDEVVKAYGLKDVKPNIIWDSGATYTNQSITWGYYTNSRHTVTLNEQALTDNYATWDSYELLETVSHELRHAYQHEAITHPTDFMVTKDTINKWNDNFQHYINADTDYEGYRNQIVERDARSFQVTRNGRYSS